MGSWTGTCSIVVVMLDTFRGSALSGGGPRRYSKTDIATYGSIWDAAKRAVLICLAEDEVGWTYAGGLFGQLMMALVRRYTLTPGGDQASKTVLEFSSSLKVHLKTG